jgi:hypothetical protein
VVVCGQIFTNEDRRVQIYSSCNILHYLNHWIKRRIFLDRGIIFCIFNSNKIEMEAIIFYTS